MPREKITLTAEFKAAVKEYQTENRIKSWSQALLALAALGYEAETGNAAPEPYATWGGWRERRKEIKAMIAYADQVTDGGRNDLTESDE